MEEEKVLGGYKHMKKQKNSDIILACVPIYM